MRGRALVLLKVLTDNSSISTFFCCSVLLLFTPVYWPIDKLHAWCRAI
jgi:hypothetical protein